MGGPLIRAVLLFALVPSLAWAYSDSAYYSKPAIEGGGGGRYFTGSRVDGYACSVCHQGATTDDFTIDPLPDNLDAGKRYDLVVHWRDPQVPHSLHVELALPTGAHPSVSLPTTLPAQSHCGNVATGTSAIYTFDIGARRIIGVEPCGASMLTLSFMATGERIDLSIAGVRGDESDSSDGDATFERRISFNVRDTSAGGCSTGTPGLLVALALLRIRRRRAR